jgi:hypothetical protein
MKLDHRTAGGGRYPFGMAPHATKDAKLEKRLKAIERTRGMYAHVAPGVSLVDELVADRRAEARAEDLAEEAERRGSKS